LLVTDCLAGAMDPADERTGDRDGREATVPLNRTRRFSDIRDDREVDDVKRTGRTDVDLAILSYDEKLLNSTRPTGVRHPWIPYIRPAEWRRATWEDGRFLTVRKAIDVRV